MNEVHALTKFSLFIVFYYIPILDSTNSRDKLCKNLMKLYRTSVNSNYIDIQINISTLCLSNVQRQFTITCNIKITLSEQ